MRGIAAGRAGADGVLVTRRLDENVGPRNTLLLNEVFDRKLRRRPCFERCPYCGGALICHVSFSFFVRHMHQRRRHPTGFVTRWSAPRMSDKRTDRTYRIK